MTDSKTYRDWQPGDGILCARSRQAPAEMPCGRPVRTLVNIVSDVRRGQHTRVTALCANHSDWGVAPTAVMLQARKAATEKLISAHWGEFQGYLKDLVQEAIDQIQPPAGAS